MFLKTAKPHPYTTCIKLPKLLVYQYTHQRSLACPKDFETSLSYVLNWRSENINFNIDRNSTNSEFNAICRVIFNQKHNLNKKQRKKTQHLTLEFSFDLNIIN